MTFENLAAWGRCLCTVCPAPTMIITSGASAVVCVWELSIAKGRPRSLHLKQVWSLRWGRRLGWVRWPSVVSLRAERPASLRSREHLRRWGQHRALGHERATVDLTSPQGGGLGGRRRLRRRASETSFLALENAFNHVLGTL